MELYQIGKMIKEYRRRQGISQEELSFGICSVATLSNIENSKELPSKRIIEKLFERLGYETAENNAYISESEIVRYDLEYLMEQKIHKRDFEISNFLADYTRNLDKMTKFDLQMFLLYSAIYGLHHNSNKDILLKKLDYTLKLTHNNYDIDFENTQNELLFSKSELLSFFYIALLKQSLPMLKFTAEYIENHIFDITQKAKYHTMVLTHLCKAYTDNKFYKEAIEVSEFGAKKCNEYGKLLYLPQLVMYKGIATYFIDREEGSKILKDSLRMSYYFCTESENRKTIESYGIKI